jgi:dTDP-4-amino-4,6-dideoxygalactose transaminase
LSAELKGVPGISCPQVDEQDRCTYWHYMLRFAPDKLRCKREEFVKAAAAEGVSLTNGYIPVLLHELPMFQQHAFFAGRWPIKDAGLTAMDYTKVRLREADAIMSTCCITPIHEGMDEDYIRGVAKGIRKVVKHFAA